MPFATPRDGQVPDEAIAMRPLHLSSPDGNDGDRGPPYSERVNSYVAMLRGINVSGHNRIKMKDLEATFVALGHSDVITYIQSGNVRFRSLADSSAEVAAGIEHGIERDFGITVRVLLRTKDELGKVVAGNPFLSQGASPAKLHVTFLADAPDQELLHQLEGKKAEPDEFHLAGREVYLHCPQGYGRTKLNNSFWERRLRAEATTRNWNTVTKLLQLAGD
jgi:uncharacterized protein (DUF1697 family)